MYSASRCTRADSSPAPATCLFAALNDLLRAVDGRVALLRPLTECFDRQRNDIDLLLSKSQRNQLLRAAFTQCTHGRVHCRIQQSSPAKAQLILWTIDCSQKLMIDLWTSFDQLPRHRRSCIPAERLLNALNASGAGTDDLVIKQSAQNRAKEKIPALRQLPPDIDLCLLIQHLATKRRTLTTSAVRERISRACDRFSSWSQEHSSQQVPRDLLAILRDVADRLPHVIIITSKFIASSEDYLLQQLACVPNNRGLRVLERLRRRGLMTGFRKTILKRRPAVAVIGSDGAGKTTSVAALAQQQPHVTPIVAKKLYRRSPTYQLASGLMKRLCGTDRGSFDDRFSPLITFLAAAASWIGISLPFSKSQRTTILDRSVASFLITSRKSDTPNLTYGAMWIESFIPPVTSVLLTMPHSELTRRKHEMSAPGHEIYQHLLFEQALRQAPTDLILPANLPSARSATAAICELLRNDTRSVEASSEESPVGKAAA